MGPHPPYAWDPTLTSLLASCYGRYYISPICVLWMVPAALLTELPTAYRTSSLSIFNAHPFIFFASGISGAGVNLTSFLVRHCPFNRGPCLYATAHQTTDLASCTASDGLPLALRA